MKNIISLITLFALFSISQAQNYIDTLYSIQTDSDVPYGTAVDFAGTPRNLKMDISVPVGDTPPSCGRPLMVIVHGGAWLIGDKADANPKRLREEFAKRGYVTASVNYRLGQFNTNANVNCNISSLFEVEWNCLNMTDTTEWYRANFRGIQDVNGAIRYLVNQAMAYNINPKNTFVVGESAGGFIAMGVGFIDTVSEVMDFQTGLFPNAPAPNSIYENPCIQTRGFATSIASMDLSRPALGSNEGTIALPANEPHIIKGVGNFYGGSFNNIFASSGGTPPALYMFHQPCDLIVPYRYSRVLAGYNNCFYGPPANCGSIFRRPFVYGSRGIQTLLDTMMVNGIPSPDYLMDNTTNTWNCLAQLTPSQSCHRIDNFGLRTGNMAAFFATKIDTCTLVSRESSLPRFSPLTIYPNPTNSKLNVKFEEAFSSVEISLYNQLGQIEQKQSYSQTKTLQLALSDLPAAIYYLSVRVDGVASFHKVVVD